MKQKILLLYLESGFGHITSMESIYNALCDGYSDKYDIRKFWIMTEDEMPALMWWNDFLVDQVQNTNKIPGFGGFIFSIISMLGGHKLMRFVHRYLARKSFKQGLETLKRRDPDVIISNHYFTDLLAVEYKLRVNPNVVVVNYNPDNILHSFWDRREGEFIVNNDMAYERALKLKFEEKRLHKVTPCVREVVEQTKLSRAELREKHGLPQDKFTVTLADGGYMLGRGPKFAKKLIKSGLPITLCVITGKNEKRYKQFKAIEEGKSKIKLAEGMTLKVYPFMDDAHELYGAADVFLTKGGPNATLDSLYMRTPVLINYCPHKIEAYTVKYYIDRLGCGERAFSKRKTVKRIAELMNDRSALDGYVANIEAFLKEGNGATRTAEIIDAAVEKQLEKLEKLEASSEEKGE